MRRVVAAFLMLGMFASSGTAAETEAHKQGRTAREILDRVDDLFRGKSSYGKMTMKVVTPYYARDLTLEAWSKGKTKSLVRILSPRKERGVCTLRSDENVWNFMPRVNRVLKIPSSMMSGAWMGSHFTNDDLVRGSRLSEEYTSRVLFEGERDGRKIIELELTPREDAPVVWGKVVVIVQDRDLLPSAIRYYDEELALARTLSFHEIRDFSGERLPSRIRMEPAEDSGAFTEIVYHELQFNPALDEDFFSLQNLSRQGQL